MGLLLAACGGGSTLTGPPGGIGGATTAASVKMTSSSPSIAADGSTTANITAIVLDKNNVAVPAVVVTFGTTAGVLTNVQATTDTNGAATATLAAAGAAVGTAITVSAKAGATASGSVNVNAVAIQRTLSAVTDLPQIPSDASKSATITALLRDANNNALPGVTVQFNSTSGVLTVTQAVTDANGLAKATLNAGSDPTNRTITVTTTAGLATATLPIIVTGTTLTLSGPANLVLNNTGNYSVVLTNSSGQGIPNATVTLSSANGNTSSAPTLTTDAAGRGSFTVTATKGGTDTITAMTTGLTQTASVAVSTQSFSITAPADGTTVNLGTAQTVTVKWLNNGAPVVAAPVTFAATRGTVVPSTPVNTDATGGERLDQLVQRGTLDRRRERRRCVGADQSRLRRGRRKPDLHPGRARHRRRAGQEHDYGTRARCRKQPRSGRDRQFRGDDRSDQRRALGAVGEDGRAGARADGLHGRQHLERRQWRHAHGDGQRHEHHRFHKSDRRRPDGVPVTRYGQHDRRQPGPGGLPDHLHGVRGRQQWCSARGPTGDALDPAGRVRQGFHDWVPGHLVGAQVHDGDGGCLLPYGGTTFCKNEDTDHTGNIASLDSGAPGTCTNLVTGAVIASHAKDYNCNGKLDPGNVAVVAPSSGNTDVNGRLDVKITYPRDHAYWTQVQLVAATTVQGTQSSTSSTFLLLGAAPDYACSNGPPGPVSPYGQAGTCANPR